MDGDEVGLGAVVLWGGDTLSSAGAAQDHRHTVLVCRCCVGGLVLVEDGALRFTLEVAIYSWWRLFNVRIHTGIGC